MASLLAYASTGKNALPAKSSGQFLFFRRQLQLREQPRILTAFLFTAKIAAIKSVLFNFLKSIIDPKRFYVNRFVLF